MNFRRLLLAIIAVGALVSSLAAVVFCVGLALYALVEPHVGPAGAAAVIFASVAAVIAVAGSIAVLVLRPAPSTRASAGGTASERLLVFVKARPVVSVCAGAALAALAIARPRAAAVAVRALARRRESSAD